MSDLRGMKTSFAAAASRRTRAAVVLCLLLAGGCGEAGGGNEETWEIDRTVTRGPVDFRVAVSRESVTIADRLTMLLEARARDGWEAELPRFGDKLDRFGIVDYRSPQPELAADGTVVSRRYYELEPFLSGEYRIPPMKLTFSREGDTLVYALESDTIAVRVGSLLPDSTRLTAQQAGRYAIRDIQGPVSFPPDRRPAWIAIGALVAAGAVAAVVILRRRRARSVAPPVPAHDSRISSLPT